jgi:hypothetical protein
LLYKKGSCHSERSCFVAKDKTTQSKNLSPARQSSLFSNYD